MKNLVAECSCGERVRNYQAREKGVLYLHCRNCDVWWKLERLSSYPDGKISFVKTLRQTRLTDA